MIGTGDGDRVRQRSLAQVRVDQGDGNAELDETTPGEQVFGPVLHQQRNDIATFEAERLRPVGVTSRMLLEFPIRVAAVFEQNGRIVRASLRPVLQCVSKGVRRVGLDLADQAQKPDHVRHNPHFARNSSKQSCQWNRPALSEES